MITNPHLVEQYEREFAKNNPLTLEQKFAIYNGMYDEAKHFGHFTSMNEMENIEEKIALAKIMNTDVTKRTR
ncbi:MAG: hypothetical protein KGZ58_12425 [Ignavibacteriales bacterium]|nr:hypothetical protein [Ignavibacteriales bacterium]